MGSKGAKWRVNKSHSPPPQVIRQLPFLSSALFTPEADMTQQGVFFPSLGQIPQVSWGM